MTRAPVEIVRAVLDDPTNLSAVRMLVSPDATYVSLNFDNPELKRLMPWAGVSCGPEAIVDTYGEVGRRWRNESFVVEEIFDSGENVAVFGRFTYRSVTLGRAATSPFSILAKVRDERVIFMQFMEDTFATASTFRSGGTTTYRADPDGGEVEIRAEVAQDDDEPAPTDPVAVLERFYAAEGTYMNAGGARSGADFAPLAATLHPDVVLHQSPDLPWGGEFHGHAGYEEWARRMSDAFDRLEVRDRQLVASGDTAVATCRLVTRSRATGETLDSPMAQVVTVKEDRIFDFRPFYWHVPDYSAASGGSLGPR